jgi:hypothetical protein
MIFRQKSGKNPAGTCRKALESPALFFWELPAFFNFRAGGEPEASRSGSGKLYDRRKKQAVRGDLSPVFGGLGTYPAPRVRIVKKEKDIHRILGLNRSQKSGRTKRRTAIKKSRGSIGRKNPAGQKGGRPSKNPDREGIQNPANKQSLVLEPSGWFRGAKNRSFWGQVRKAVKVARFSLSHQENDAKKERIVFLCALTQNLLLFPLCAPAPKTHSFCPSKPTACL